MIRRSPRRRPWPRPWTAWTSWTLLVLVQVSCLVVSCLVGCAEPEPIERKILLVDLLDGAPAGAGPAARSVVLPERPAGYAPMLDVSGCAAPKGRGTARAAPVFRLEVDGEAVMERRVSPRHPAACFDELIPLAAQPAEEIHVGWSIEGPGTDELRLAWNRVNLVRTEATPRAESGEGPDLLLVVADTLRADHCSLYGYERETTPHLEEMARDALVFERALSPSSWTLPATASLLTGQTPLRHGVVGSEKMPQRLHTLAEELQASGFTTVGISANPIIDSRFGFEQGFETFEHAAWRPAEELVDRFLSWLDGREEGRFFAYLHFFDPHSPYRVPEGAERPFTDASYRGPYRDMRLWDELHRAVNRGLEEVPPRPTAEDMEFLVAAYDEEIRYWDSQLGRLVAELEARGRLDDTIVVVTSDHGEEFAEHGMYQHGHQLFDESIRVPLVIRGPRWVEPGRRDDPVSIRRLHPTLLRLARGEEPAGEDLRRSEGKSAEKSTEALPAISYVTVGSTPNAVRRDVERWAAHTDRWTYLVETRHDDGSAEPAGGRLFDMRSDPRQERDLSAEERRTAETLHRYLEEQRAAAESGSDTADPHLLEELRALGYVD